VVRLLIEAGADPNVAVSGMWHAETPLHWAASTDDVDVAAALIDAGAHLEAQGGSIGGPLENAVGYECWHVARLLVDRGAPVDTLWVAVALGLEPWIEDRFAQRPLRRAKRSTRLSGRPATADSAGSPSFCSSVAPTPTSRQTIPTSQR
jgi:uncharacterized protein